MKSQNGIGRRDLLKKLATSAVVAGVAAAIPASAEALAESSAAASGSATIRVILSDGISVQWLAVTDGGITVGGKTVISGKPSGLNAAIIRQAAAAIVAAGGPQLTRNQVTLFGGAA